MVNTCVAADLVEAELNLGRDKSDTHAKFLCKGTYMLPYEFRAKEIDEHPQEENIAERVKSH